MDTDSDSQDSDDGRRFRFETTRKDAVSLPKTSKKLSPEFSRHLDHQSHSKDENSHDLKSRYLKSHSSYKCRSSNEKDINTKNSIKDRSSRDTNSISKDLSSKRHNRDSRSHHGKDCNKSHVDNKDHNSKQKSTSRVKHKKYSKDKIRERKSQAKDYDESLKKETMDSNTSSPLIETTIRTERQREIKKQRSHGNDEIHENLDRVIDIGSPLVPSDNTMNSTSTMLDSTVLPCKKKVSYFERVVNKKRSSEDSSVYGPALPPYLEKKLLTMEEMEERTTRSLERADSPIKSINNSDQDQQVIRLASPPSPESFPIQKMRRALLIKK